MQALRDVNEVYTLAADMGGMGFISQYHYWILVNNARINLNVAMAAGAIGIQRLLYTSSACVYPEIFQTFTDARKLAEIDAWQGKPDTAYGVEKLMAEDIYQRLAEKNDLPVSISRFHNIYGPEGSWTGGREKAPAALCRKVAQAKLAGEHQIEVWGDGLQTRSFCHISDCLEMLYRLMRSGYDEPLNIGTDRAVSINELAQIISDVADWPVEIVHVNGPQGVRGRNADLSEMKRVLDYEPQVSLEAGMAELYTWIEEQVQDAAR